MLRSCGSTLLCPHCRARRNARVRGRFVSARLGALTLARRSGALVGHARWTEKFLTLTVPHRSGGDVLSAERRVELLADAWDLLRRWLRREFDAAARGAARAHWYAAHEWTEGQDGLGHPHVHVWLLSPYLERARLVAAWRDVLARCGHVWAEGEGPIVDLRLARGRDGRPDGSCAKELIKYMTKDLREGARGFVPPALYARIYVLYDGRRRIQGSRGFIALGESSAATVCPDCGEVHGFEVTTIREGTEAHTFAVALARGAIAERQRARKERAA